MKSAKSLIWILLLAIILFNWMVLYKVTMPEKPNTIQLQINFPKEKESPYVFSEKTAWDLTKNKKKIQITLDNNPVLNRKRFDVINYEARKMKVTMDSSTVIIINFTSDMPFSEFLKIVLICQNEILWTYVPVKRGFIITGLYPLPKKEDKENEIEFIDM
jgi:hypothetical protein